MKFHLTHCRTHAQHAHVLILVLAIYPSTDFDRFWFYRISTAIPLANHNAERLNTNKSLALISI